MEAVDLLTGYADKLKRSAKELGKLEKAAKQLADKQQETDAQRHTLEEQLTEHHRKAASLQSEHQDNQLTYMQSVYQQDSQAQRTAQTRRVAIEEELKQHGESIDELSKSLGELPTYDEEAAKIAAELDALEVGGGSYFANNLRVVLLQNETALEARQDEAHEQLPPFTEETRLRVDTAYREEKERKQQMKEQEARRVRAKMEENERKARTITGIRRAQ